MIRSSKDAKATLHDQMRVEIVGENTYLIEVGLASKDPDEAAKIVNAVVESYIAQHNSYHQKSNRALKRNLETERDRLEQQIQDKQEYMQKLVEHGNVVVSRRIVAEPDDKAAEKGAVSSSLSAVTEKQLEEMSSKLIQADFELMDARARLDAMKLSKTQASAEKIRDLEAAVEEASLKRLSYRRYIAQLQVTSGPRNTEQLRTSLLNQDLTYLKKLQDTINQKLAQVNFEIGQEQYKISVQDKADVPKVPANNQRLKYMTVAPVVILFLIIGAFLVREIKATRRDAPEATA
jgi:hypothetical protein